MTRHQVIIGLDAGTTAVKAVAFGLDGGRRYSVLRDYPQHEPVPGRHEQDPQRVLAASVEALAECAAAVADADVVGVAVSTAMHGLIALDDQMQPITPLLTWADARAHAEARELHEAGVAHDLHRRTGAPVHPMTPLTKLRWFARHEPEVFASARWWVGLKDYVLWGLTGTLATELSSAGGTGMLDMATRSWSAEALTVADIDADRLPPILSTTAALTLAAEPARRAGLPPGTPVLVGAADGPLGNLGTGAVIPGVVGVSLGTSGAVRMVVPEPRVDEAGSLFCYALTDDAWAVGGAISNGGLVVRWAASALAPDVIARFPDRHPEVAVLDLADSVPPGADGLVVLPYLVAERAPLWDPDLPGAVLGLRIEHTRAHLIRASVEGVCRQLRAILDRVDALAPVTAARATGGAFRSRLWREVLAAMLERPLTVADDAEGTALGAAALGLYALGVTSTPLAATQMLASRDAEQVRTVTPDPELAATYTRLRAHIEGLADDVGRVATALAPLPRGQVTAEGDASGSWQLRASDRSPRP